MLKQARSTRRRRIVASTAAVALFMTACGGGSDDGADDDTDATSADASTDDGSTDDDGTDEPAEDLGEVTVALSVPESVPFIAADLGPSQGKFDDCGITVRNIAGESSTVGRSLAAGEADIALQAAPRAVGEIMQGIPGKLVAGQKNPWSQVLVVSNELAEQGVETPEDVEALGGDGYAFGISSFGSAGHLSVLRLAEYLDWEEGTDYEILSLGGVSEITAGLESGAIDAFTWSREVAYRMEDEGVGLVIEDIVPEAVGPIIFEGFVASDTFIEERPEALVAYFECYFAYVEELKNDPDQARQLALDEWGANEQTLDRTLERILDELSPDGSATDEELTGLEEGATFQNEEIDEAPIEEWWVYWQDLR